MDCHGYRVWLLLAEWNDHGLTCSASSMSPVQGVASCSCKDTPKRKGVQREGHLVRNELWDWTKSMGKGHHSRVRADKLHPSDHDPPPIQHTH